MRTTREELKWQRETAEYYAQCLDKGGKILISITHTSQSNLSYRYKVWLIYAGGLHNSGKRHYLSDLSVTYWLASVQGKNLTDRDEIKGQGVGFNRYQFIFNEFCKALEDCGIDLDKFQNDRGTWELGYLPIN